MLPPDRSVFPRSTFSATDPKRNPGLNYGAPPGAICLSGTEILTAELGYPIVRPCVQTLNPQQLRIASLSGAGV